MAYDIGDLVKLTAAFTDAAGTAIDPTTVTFKILKPDGTTTTAVYGVDPAVVKAATGVYTYNVSITAAGMWWWRVTSTGTGQAAEEAALVVNTQTVT
jgi:hypothetical protein